MNGIIFLHLNFYDPKLLEKPSTVVPVGPDGKITKEKFEISSDGYATISADDTLTKFPATWEIRQGTKRFATILIPNHETFKKVWMEPNSVMDPSKLLIYAIDEKGVVNLTIGRPKPLEIKPVNYVIPAMSEKWMKGKALDKAGQALKNTPFIIYIHKKGETQHKDINSCPCSAVQRTLWAHFT